MPDPCQMELCPYWPGEGCLRGVMPCPEPDGCDCPPADDICNHCGRIATQDHKDRCHRTAVGGDHA